MARDNERPARGNSGAGRRENNRFSSDRPRNDRGEKKIFNRRDKYEDTDRRSFNSERGEEGERKSFRDRREGGERRDFNREDRGERRNFNREGGERKSFNNDRRNGEGRSFNREDRNEGGEVKRFSFKRNNEESDNRGFKPRREEGEERNYNREERGERRSFNRDDRGERRSFNDRKEGVERRSFGDRTERDDRRNYSSERRDERRAPREEGSERRSFRSDRDDRKPFSRDNREGGEKRSFNREDRGERRSYSSERNEAGERRSFKSDRSDNREERPFRREERSFDGEKRNFKPERGGKFNNKDRKTSFSNREELGEPETPNYNTKHYENNPRIKKSNRKEENDGTIRLNRFIANAGICSRREADTLIESGEIKVNGQVVTEMGFKVRPEDTVQYGKKILNREKLVYVLLNKPKDFLTTTDDPEGRKTVMSLVEKASNERIFPVGRLDRNTTGLLLFTNDGELAQKLTHPSNGVKKIYQVELDKQITKEDFLKVTEGVELEDGKAEVDDVALIGDTGKFLGLEIHIGRNRIVRRIFEHLGYEVVSLDRVQYAGLTKKDLPRGNWRYLTEKELIRLKYFM